jgi:hypothetical protein
MNTLKNISFLLVMSFIYSLVADKLQSVFIFIYLKDNIISILTTLLAINTATLGLIASKIQDVIIKYPTLDFNNSMSEMKKSLLELFMLIILSLISLLFSESPIICFEFKDIFFNTILLSILLYAVNVLWDSGKAVFIIIDEIKKL